MGANSIESVLADLRPPFPHRRISVALLIGLVVLCSGGACVGMASIAGFAAVGRRLAVYDWPWFAASAGGVLVAFVGYRFAFDRLVWSDGHGVSWTERLGVVAAGFGAFVPKGGTALDRYIMRITGRDRRDSDVRLAALQALEMAPIALGACLAAYLALFVGGHDSAPIGYSVPWAIGPIIGTPLVGLLARRYHRRLRDTRGVRYWVGITLEGIALIGSILRRPRSWLTLFGMALFSAGELAAVWTAMAAFGYRMPAVALVLGYGVGYVVSRRSAPLGGSGLIDVVLILALANVGAPLAVAVVGTFTYRFFNLWCSVPASLAALGGIRRLVVRRHRWAAQRG